MFDGDGSVVTTLESGNFCGVRALAVQPDGKILAAGQGGNLQGSIVVRYESNGALDMTFGQAGVAKAWIPGEPMDADTMALLPDGKILVAGFQFKGQAPQYSSWNVVRLDATGQIDATFGIAGVAEIETYPVAPIVSRYEGPGMVVLPDGSVILGASTRAGLSEKMLAWKIGPDGKLDATFGDMGKAIVPSVHGTFSAYGIGLQPDGKVVLGGRGFSAETGTDFGFVRLIP